MRYIKYIIVGLTLTGVLLHATYSAESLQAQANRLESEKSDLSAQLDEKLEKVGKLKETISNNQSKIDELNKENDILSTSLKEQARKAQLSQDELSIIYQVLSAKSISDILTPWRAMEKFNESAQSKKKQLESNKAELIKSNTELNASMKSLNSEIDDLNATVKDTDSQLTNANLQLTKAQQSKIRESSQAAKDVASAGASTPTGSAEFGPGDEHAAFDKITSELGLSDYEKSVWSNTIEKESGWSATNQNPSSDAYGIGQALPPSKMAPFGADYMTNPYTQLKWMHSYIMGRYGSFAALESFWAANSWY